LAHFAFLMHVYLRWRENEMMSARIFKKMEATQST
jgi:hypothetical protein